MKKLLLITMMISGFCIAGNDVRPRIEEVITMVWLNAMNNPQQSFTIETQSLLKIEKKNCLHQKSRCGNSNNHNFAKKRNKQQNAYIHQPRSNNYAAKNRR